ncbi:MAG: 30S ribosomal protein S8 [Ignavibacteriae bacterium HGW-Ignavibacteriae-2]|jgi:small subunit ribosomal protein S8|nr:MAG: 30S ribosomal protein S8 [Ignavibacteriae bacterium HGW-Ignavibacteriae-2]
MPVTDPIADFLTRVRNAVKAKKKFVDIPASNTKVKMAEILKDANFIRDFNVIEDGKQNIVRVHLKYVEGSASITGLKKISTPGLRTYVGKEDIPKVLNGLGIAIISTSKGLLTDKQARLESIGGEVICHVW